MRLASSPFVPEQMQAISIKQYATPINFVLFQVGWFACVWGAGVNFNYLGPGVVAILVPLQIYFLTSRFTGEMIFAAICGVSGFFLETIMIISNVYLPVNQPDVLFCPPWMAALWFNFSMLVSISLAWLKEKYFLAAFLGGLAGPVAYWGGEKLNAIIVADVFWEGYAPLSLLWAISLPGLICIHSLLVIRKK